MTTFLTNQIVVRIPPHTQGFNSDLSKVISRFFILNSGHDGPALPTTLIAAFSQYRLDRTPRGVCASAHERYADVQYINFVQHVSNAALLVSNLMKNVSDVPVRIIACRTHTAMVDLRTHASHLAKPCLTDSIGCINVYHIVKLTCQSDTENLPFQTIASFLQSVLRFT